MAALLFAAAGTVASAGAANAQAAPTASVTPAFPGVFHEIRNNLHTPAMCAQPATLNFGTPIIQAPCNGTSIQGWFDNKVDDFHHEFINSATSLCMFTGGTLMTGTPVFLGECAVAGGTAPVSNAVWTSSRPLPSLDVTLQTHVGGVDHNFCLDEPGNTGDSVALQLATCNGTNAQRWSVGFN